MRLMLARDMAQSPWMNPGRWSAVASAALEPDSDDGAWNRDHYEAVLSAGSSRAGAADRVREAVLAYRIFPPERLIAALPTMIVRPGDTIVQGIRLGPLGIIAAVRVTTVFDRERDGIRRTGLSYVTLEGHPERGAMTCAVVEELATQTARIEIDTLSRPGHWLTRLAGPFARRAQQGATRAALTRLVALAGIRSSGDCSRSAP